MNTPLETFEERLAKLGELFSDWLEALESGKSLDRQDWLAQYPEYAAELEEFLAENDRMRFLAAPLREAAQAALVATPLPWQTLDLQSTAISPDEPQPSSFGDYELLEEIGRGGMAVVYRARQRKLARFVALKLFRTDRLGRVADLERFRHEAQIVAQLDHPLVVPIYEVGEQQGYIYFTMKLIEGGSLDAHLSRFISEPRAVASLSAAISRAVHHAHQRGILHRDLKPSNILLTGSVDDPPDQLVPHISDFGLAKRVDTELSLTQTGAVVGTPAYMAPEQAVSEKNAITTATDVYGLGAVLYALLTGKAPFRGESVLETLSLVKEREPEPPRRINSNVPRDLETICLKCLHKEPQRRYESSSALADDLERWLKGESIAARPVGRLERLWRWCRRQPIQASLASGLLLAVVCGFILVLWQWRRAEANSSRAEENFASAEDSRRKTAEREIEADESFHFAHDAIRDVTEILETRGELERRGLDPIRRELLLKTQGYYRKFLERRRNDPTLKLELAQASATLADIIRQTGSPTDALEAYEQALLQVRTLLEEDPDNLSFRMGRAELYNQVSAVYRSLNRWDEANESLKIARGIVDQCLLAHPEDPTLLSRLALLVQNIGVNQAASNRLDNALKCYGEAKTTLEKLLAAHPNDMRFLEALALTLNNIAMVHTQQGQSTSALDAYRQAVEKSEQLAKLYPTERKFQHAFAQYMCNLADQLLGNDDAKQALAHLNRAEIILDNLTRGNPSITDYQVTLGLCCSMIGTASIEIDQLDRVGRSFDRAQSIFRQLAKDYPGVPDYSRRLVRVLINMAKGHQRLKHAQPANDIYEEAQDLATKLVESFPNEPTYEAQLAEVLHNLAEVQTEAGRFGDARELTRQALKWDQRVFDRDTSLLKPRHDLTSHYAVLAAVDRQLGWIDEAMDAAKKRWELWPNEPVELYTVAADFALTAAAAKNNMTLQRRCGDLAIETLGLAIKAGYRDFEHARANAHLDFIRSRPEFQQLLAEMQKSP